MKGLNSSVDDVDIWDFKQDLTNKSRLGINSFTTPTDHMRRFESSSSITTISPKRIFFPDFPFEWKLSN